MFDSHDIFLIYVLFNSICFWVLFRPNSKIFEGRFLPFIIKEGKNWMIGTDCLSVCPFVFLTYANFFWSSHSTCILDTYLYPETVEKLLKVESAENYIWSIFKNDSVRNVVFLSLDRKRFVCYLRYKHVLLMLVFKIGGNQSTKTPSLKKKQRKEINK